MRVVDVFPQEDSFRACQGDEPDDCGIDARKHLDCSLVVFDGGRAVFVENQWSASQRVETGGFSIVQYRQGGEGLGIRGPLYLRSTC